ncbi:MAG TPA: hypothetical protein VN157_12080 [Caulobacter sp.]|nr:hypothetical protein [Caulobacter sp.]
MRKHKVISNRAIPISRDLPKDGVVGAVDRLDLIGDNNGAYRRDPIWTVAQKVELLSPTEARICGSKVELLRTPATTNGVETAVLDVRGFVPKWRPLFEMRENYSYDIVL